MTNVPFTVQATFLMKCTSGIFNDTTMRVVSCNSFEGRLVCLRECCTRVNTSVCIFNHQQGEGDHDKK
jgi:hypothetical protein